MPVVCFAKLVETGFRAICAEQHAPYIQFLPRAARKKSNVPKLKTKSLLSNLYTVIKVVKESMYPDQDFCL